MKSTHIPSEITYSFFWKNLEKFSGSELSLIERFLLPQHRSSTIFPIYLNHSTATLRFLSYWLKKHDTKVLIKFTARDILGNSVGTDFWTILRYQSMGFRADNFDYFKSSNEGFCGSIEVEVFSELKPLYTFPAISLVYQNLKGCAVVHSCVRTYNRQESITDYALNFPQTGFDLFLSDDCRNYICFFGGRKSRYELTLILGQGSEQRKASVQLDNVRMGQLHLLYVEDLFDEIRHADNLKLSIIHDLDVFPRFYAGIVKISFVPTLTHSFFDTSENNFAFESPFLNLRSKNENPEGNFDCALMLPVYPNDKYKTSLKTYSQNLTHHSEIYVTAYSDSGQILIQDKLDSKAASRFNLTSSFDILELLKSNRLFASKRYSLHIGFANNSKKPFPKRFKLALNVCRQGAELGSNICFAPLVLDETTLAKPFNRRWFPIGGKERFVASIHNTSILRNRSGGATSISCEFFNISGDLLVREMCLTENSSLYLDTDSDNELSAFFRGETGWCLVNSKSYHCDSYYFATSGSLIGGDHAY